MTTRYIAVIRGDIYGPFDSRDEAAEWTFRFIPTRFDPREIVESHVSRLQAPTGPTTAAKQFADLANDLDYYASKTTGGAASDGYADAAVKIREVIDGSYLRDEPEPVR